GRRERLDGDIDKQPNWIFGILLERALGSEMNGRDQILSGKPDLVPVNPQDNAAIDRGIAHSGDHLDDCATAFYLLHQSINVDLGNRTRTTRIGNDFGWSGQGPRRREVRLVSSRSSAARRAARTCRE